MVMLKIWACAVNVMITSSKHLPIKKKLHTVNQRNQLLPYGNSQTSDNDICQPHETSTTTSTDQSRFDFTTHLCINEYKINYFLLIIAECCVEFGT